MHYYTLNGKTLISDNEYSLASISEQQAASCSETVYFLKQLDPMYSRSRYSVTDKSLLFIEKEGLELIKKTEANNSSLLPEWLKDKIIQSKLTAVNTLYPCWENQLYAVPPKLWRINVIGLGDVGGTLVSGLRLLGGDIIHSIGIYDIDRNKVNRWLLECNQILSPDNCTRFPEVVELNEDSLFDCDMFVFCVTIGVPPLEGTAGDVRMMQLEGNSKIVNIYARKARAAGFKGIFAVVSDPVDILCKSAFLSSNTDDTGGFDFKGLPSDCIRGYGLGVMHARAVYYYRQMKQTDDYERYGRAFGPHGEHLIIANNMLSYDDKLSHELTDRTRNANMEVRAAGYKPYIAPALSSGALSLLATVRGQWHYSATYMGGVYMGSRNRLTENGTELEQYDMPDVLWKRLEKTYNILRGIM
ncbi:MAG: lactate/malate family dehydrogenase [Bacillota bacterium]